MNELPAGTVSFLFTDLVGSTRLWEEHPTTMRAALARHDALLRNAVEVRGGVVVKTTGDGVHAAFSSPVDALEAAVDAQRSLRDGSWDGVPPLHVRIGVHTGVAELRDGDYYGSTLNRAARLMSISHGDQIVCSEATASLARDALGDEVTLRDLGDHRLRDLSESEHVFQVDAPGLPFDFPALAGLDVRTTNLPLQQTSFFGREQEVDDVVGLCRVHPLVTITGVGGIGKTRLALQAAAEMVPSFRDGVWLCELAPATDPESVAAIVAEVLDARPRPGLSIAEVVVEVVRRKELLLLLDNCEHVLDAAADLASAIVDRCPEARVLATSREGLAIEGERVRPLRSLAVPDDDSASVSSAVQLFADRARAMSGEFVLDDDNIAAVVEICRRLDGMPLAIELAAARVVAMQPSEIASHLDERFRLLAGNRRRAVERHQTLRATVEWSYSLLSPVEQLIFDRLSVFAGSFDGSATAVAGDDALGSWEVLDALQSLVAKSMVNADELASTTRYSLLETLRSYGQERLDATGEADARRRRHAAYYAELATRLGPAIHGADELATMAAIRRDLDNFRSATLWALDSVDDHDIALEIVSSLAGLASCDRASGVSSWADQCVPYLHETTPGRGASILGAAAWYALDRGEPLLARERATASLSALYEPDCSEPVQALSALAVQSAFFGDQDPVVAMLDHVEPLRGPPLQAYELSVLYGTAAALHQLLPDRGDSARELAALAMQYAEECQNPTARANSLFALAFVGGDDTEIAAALYEESIALIEAGAADTIYSHARRGASRVARNRGNAAASADHLTIAIKHAERVGDSPTLGTGLDEAVLLLFAVDDPEGASVILAYSERSPLPVFLPPGDAQRIRDGEERARCELGDTAYSDARRRGRAMDEHDVVAFTLERLARILTATEPPR